MSLGDFVRDFYLRLPFAGSGSPTEVVKLCDWNLLSNMIMRPGADLLICRRNQRFEGECPKSAEAMQKIMAAGNTILVRHAELIEANLGELADAFRQDFSGE